MKLNFPIEKVLTCRQCEKDFAITITDKDTHRYVCPDCGTTHTLEASQFDALERKAIAEVN